MADHANIWMGTLVSAEKTVSTGYIRVIRTADELENMIYQSCPPVLSASAHPNRPNVIKLLMIDIMGCYMIQVPNDRCVGQQIKSTTYT